MHAVLGQSEQPIIPPDVQIRCKRCGRGGLDLRATTFLFTFSIVVMTFRNPSSGVFCSRCRRIEGATSFAASALLGWWGIPWGPIYTVQSLAVDSRGGSEDRDVNAQLLIAIAEERLGGGQRSEAIDALRASLEYRDDPSTRAMIRTVLEAR